MFMLAIKTGPSHGEYPQDEIVQMLRQATALVENGQNCAALYDTNGDPVGNYLFSSIAF